MSQVQEALRERGIFNDHNCAEMGDKVFVSYSSAQTGFCSARWKVYKIGKRLSDHWYDRDAKCFPPHAQDGDSFAKRKRAALLAALDYARTLNDERTWVRTPFGGWVSLTTAQLVGIKPTLQEVLA